MQVSPKVVYVITYQHYFQESIGIFLLATIHVMKNKQSYVFNHTSSLYRY